MVDSNLQRERISYSEKAFAYKMKNDAMKRTAGRPRNQIDHNLKGKRTVEIIAEETGESPKQVQRYDIVNIGWQYQNVLNHDIKRKETCDN